uniref:glucan endo-1,3-beta-D-glucosidase n=1 Tax=Davidia involucrata TaxID=16924 RepID=A0A5B7BF89_DAVIN
MGFLDLSYGGVVPILLLLLFMVVGSVSGIGANWGTQATHPLPPSTVVKLLKDNGFQQVKLFDADSSTLNALSRSGIEVMVGIPNDMLYTLANSVNAAEQWVQQNVSSHVSSNGVNIRYVAVGNEPFLPTYNGSFLETTFPALRNIQSALVRAGLGTQVKVTIPLNADVYQTSTGFPSGGDFRPDIHDLMVEIVQFLSDNGAPFTVNIYPFISLYDDPNFPVDYAFFDGYSSPLNDNGRIYNNVFDANHDTLVWTLQKNGFGNLSIIIGEIGWPTDGDHNANVTYAQRFNQGFMSHISSGNGTPMRPGPVNAYLFSLIDEDAKSIQPGNFERHWGIFSYDGTPKYNLNLGSTSSGGLVAASNIRYIAQRWCIMSPSASLDDPEVASSVSYACQNADCTSLGYGTSCGNLDGRGNISYAFNSYYQQNNQLDSACKFPNNLSVFTTTDPSVGDCKFKIMIQTLSSGVVSSSGFSQKPVPVGMVIFMFMLSSVF